MGIPKETIPLCHQAGPMGQGWAPTSLQPPCDLCMVLMGLQVSERCTSPTGYGVRGAVAPEVGGWEWGPVRGLVLELRLSTSTSAPAVGWGEHRSCSGAPMS